jgi:hypothetical protein
VTDNLIQFYQVEPVLFNIRDADIHHQKWEINKCYFLTEDSAGFRGVHGSQHYSTRESLADKCH